MKLFILVCVFVFASVAEAQQTLPQIHLSPTEIQRIVGSGGGPGTSGLSGIRSRVLAGDPTKPGLYTIQLSVPANTTIQAHSHPDERVATVISGSWQIGFGPSFSEAKLKVLEPGSFYTEPGGELHFARTGKKPVVIHITGYGPTGTEYNLEKPKQ